MPALFDTMTRKFLIVPERRMGGILLACLLCILVAFGLAVWKIDRNIRDGNFCFLEETASRIGRAVALRISISSHTLEAVGMGHAHDWDDAHFAGVERVYTRLGLSRLIYVGKDGVGHDHGGKSYDFAGNDAVMAALGGKIRAFDCQLLQGYGADDSHEDHLGLAVPVHQDSEVVGAVVADVGLHLGRSLLNSELLEGKLVFSILDRNGILLLKFSDIAEDIGKHKSQPPEILVEDIARNDIGMRIAKLQGARASFGYTSRDGTQHSAVLVPVPEYGLYTLVVSTGRFGIEEFAFVDRTVFLLFGLTTGVLVFLCVMLCLFYRYSRRLAFVDPVTHGMSPVRFGLEYDRKVALAGRGDASLYCIDINRFKLINDFFGHEEGDRLLRLFHASMERELSGKGACLCRASRDMYFLLACGLGMDYVLSSLDRALLSSIREFGSREGTGRNSSFSVSVGICPITSTVSDLAVVKDRADIARERASMSFGNFIHYGIFDEEDMQRARREHSIESCMTQSLENGDFYILLQPKVVLSTGAICGAEALVRWHHPQLGLIMPDEFIPLFERNGFVKRIDMWVFERVCAMMARWIGKGYRLLPVSVNLSRCDLENRLSLAEELAKIADAYGVPHEYLDLEITETSFYKDPASIRRVVDGMRKASFQCSIDDFGTGYSSLNLLPDLSVATIKIDRSFLSSGDMEKSSEVIRMVVELADRLGMKVIAEGVETEKQREFLRSCSCQVGQGFLYSKPVSEEEFERMAFGSEGAQAQDKSAKES